MNCELNPIFQTKNKVIHIFGLPGTYKTAFLVQIIFQKLKEGVDQIFLVDASGNFPYVKLKPIEDLLSNLIVFQPKSLKDELLIIDDLDIKGITDQTILLIDDIFHRINPDEENHLESYILAIIQALSQKIIFPIFLTNQGRGFENQIHPLRATLMKRYFDDHLFFQKTSKNNVIQIMNLVNGKYEFLTELQVDSFGLFPDIF
ncbi:MAG: hypothetical protein ACW98I_06020 [Candidatus Hodarchaeales archaeon]|jgi:hypothetical protein